MKVTELRHIVENIKEEKEMGLGEIAKVLKLDRSYFSRIINSPDDKEISSSLLFKITRKFPDQVKSVVDGQHRLMSMYTKDTIDTESVVNQKSQPYGKTDFSVSVEDYINEIKRSREFAERMLDKTISNVGLSLEEQKQLLHAMQADLLARTQVALDSLARLENSKKPPKLNEDADRISAESQGMIARKGNGAGGTDD